MKYLLPLPLLLAAPLAGHAQLGLYAGFTTSKLDVANTPRFNGGTFGAYYDRDHFPILNFGADVRGTVLSTSSNNVTTSVTAVTAGPRAVVHLPLVPLRPYIEGLVGGAHTTVGQGAALYDGTGLAAGFAAGADFHVLPYIDWRVIDYSYTRLVGPGTYQKNFTSGIVVRIPFS